MKTPKILSVSVAALLSASSALASIQVPLGNAPLQDFAILPALTEWSTNTTGVTTGPFAGTATLIVDNATFDTQVALLSASDMTQALVSGAAVGTNNSGKWRSDTLHAATQPTGVSFNGIMANMTNAASVPLTSINISWTGGVDLAASTNADATDDNGYLNGHRLYYSTSGAANSFFAVTDPLNAQTQTGNYLFPASTSATPSQTWTASVLFPASVAPGSPFYLLWADDNALTNADGAYFIDDVLITGVPEPTSVVALLTGLCVLSSRRRRRA